MKKIIAGNWKMNHLAGDAKVFCEFFQGADIKETVVKHGKELELVVCPPFPLISLVKNYSESLSFAVGAQDCHQETSGAFTGEVSANLLKDLGCKYVILGHSERRALYKENSKLVEAKATAALSANLIPIICVGENLEERESGKAYDVVANQLKGSLPKESGIRDIVIAYEPVWAIGTGKTATVTDIKKMHQFIFELIGEAKNIPILYGGSVKPDNASEILAIPHVGGVLVGGASLRAHDFWTIAKACF